MDDHDDDLHRQFGQLSTQAAEWRPAGPSQPTFPATSHRNYTTSTTTSTTTTRSNNNNDNNDEGFASDLRATTVKEFIPGQGWTSATAAATTTSSTTTTLSSSIIPAAPAPPPALSSSSSLNHQASNDHTYPYHPAHEAATTSHTSTTSSSTTTLPFGPSPPPLPAFRALHSLGLSDDLWRHYRDLAWEASVRQMDPNDPRHKAVPLPYCNAYCLDSASTSSSNNNCSSSTSTTTTTTTTTTTQATHALSSLSSSFSSQGKRRGASFTNTSTTSRRSSFGYPSATFQVISREDGHWYCLRRFDSVKSVSPRIAAAVSDRWSQCTPVQEHPAIVPLYQCFVAQRAVFFVHHYIPGARSLEERLAGQPLSEPVVWSCIVQLVSALHTIHANGLAARTLDPQHVLATTDSTASRLRLRLNCMGIVDALEFEARKPVADLQQEDIRNLGRLIVALATGGGGADLSDADTLTRCDAFLAQNYSRELHNLAMTLIRSTPRPPSILDISRAIAVRSLEEHDAAYRAVDRTEAALSAEYESGRALRLLLKLSFMTERPELGPNRRWSQSGDCYVLSLFRDFVFHQADGAGHPILDLGHVITALNKLDAADEEQIVLASRDGKSLLVVSYADVARCLESAFAELSMASVPPAALQY